MQNTAKKITSGAIAITLVAGLSLPLSATPAFADPTTEEQAASALEQLSTLQEQLGQAENDYNQAVADKQDAEKKIVEAQDKISEAEDKIAEVQEKLGTRARSMYRTGSTSIIDLILGSTTWSEFVNNWSLLEILNNNDAELVAETKSLRDELNEQKATLEENKKIAEEKEKSAAATLAETQTLVNSQQAVYNNLSEEAAAELERQQAQEQQQQQQQVINNIENNNTGGTTNSNVNNSKPQTVTGNVVVDRAYAELGKPYVWCGVGPDGYDCSGFVSYCLTGSHSRLGTTYTFMNWTQVTDPQPGDVCICSYHTGIYIGGGQMIHAATYGVGVVISSVQSDMWFVRY